jgi:hypothetical protein
MTVAPSSHLISFLYWNVETSPFTGNGCRPIAADAMQELTEWRDNIRSVAGDRLTSHAPLHTVRFCCTLENYSKVNAF